jgi:SAM-dependent methyltransferase
MTWAQHVSDWSAPPVDDVGYMESASLLQYPDDQLRVLVDQMRATRYGGWRNHDGKWRDVMGLDSTTGLDVLDFGCGVGVESLELALVGNQVTVADISESNLALACRVLGLYGCEPVARLLVTDTYPFIQDGAYDVFYCNGVLHHVRWPEQVMGRAHELLRPGGEARLMVYSDRGWRNYIGTEPPTDTASDPHFQQFVRTFDQVGSYADWYDEEKLTRMFGDLFTVDRFSYLTDNDRYCAAVLTRKD